MKPLCTTLLALAACAVFTACSGASSATSSTLDELSRSPDATYTKGALTLVAHDFIAPPGILWALPSVKTASGSVTVENTRYGSLCLFDVSGQSTLSGSQLTLDITFSQRLTSCIAEIRALRYSATVTVPKGTYELAVVHHENTESDTLVRRTIVVP